jgi:putative transposase
LLSCEERTQALDLIKEACTGGARKSKACELLGIAVRTVERWEKENGLLDKRCLAKRFPGNKLTPEERSNVLQIANSKKYQHLPPCKIVPILADEGQYVASESTFYRILREEKQLTHRLLSRPAKHHKPEEYIAMSANQVWTWDITYLPSQTRGLYFYLYLIVDIFSRKIVGWSVHDVELSDLAASLIKQACLDENIPPGQIVLHSDNGGPMKGMTMRAMLELLGVLPSFSRPSVSDDNPYSEALFRTLKYHPSFPKISRFASITEARVWCEKFTTWYNNEHLHSGLNFITPHQRHTGEGTIILANRHNVYESAKKAHPERWSGKTRNWSLPDRVSLNPDKKNGSFENRASG